MTKDDLKLLKSWADGDGTNFDYSDKDWIHDKVGELIHEFASEFGDPGDLAQKDTDPARLAQ